jgi:hypothetical protein
MGAKVSSDNPFTSPFAKCGSRLVVEDILRFYGHAQDSPLALKVFLHCNIFALLNVFSLPRFN